MSMRVPLLIVAFALVLAGCANKGADTTTTSTLTTPTAAGGNTARLAIVPTLATSLALDAPAWVEPGATVPVAASAPGASGAVTWIWATGPLAGSVAAPAKPLDTGLIDPGTSKTLTFSDTGIFAIHCHPHPFMRSNVTVIQGYVGADTIDVQIQDGATPGDYRFVPENIIVGVGTKVTYHDVGSLAHTATELSRTPPLTKASLTGASGSIQLPTSVPMSGMDMQMAPEWTHVVVIAKDAQGHVGFANASVYVNTFPLPFNTTMTGNFEAGGLPDSPVTPTPDSKGFSLDMPGTLFLNFTANDAASGANGALPNQAAIDVHVKRTGDTRDLVGATGKTSGSLSARVGADTFTITVAPNAGANVDYKLFVTVVYDHVPPAPTIAGAGGMEGMDHTH